MKTKKKPIRFCVVSKERLPKEQLLRIVKKSDGDVIVDLSGKCNGRGAYIKKDMDTLNLAIKNKALERALDIKISMEVYENIKNIINN